MKLPYSEENITERLENQSAFPSQFINKNYAFRRFLPCPDLFLEMSLSLYRNHRGSFKNIINLLMSQKIFLSILYYNFS